MWSSAKRVGVDALLTDVLDQPLGARGSDRLTTWTRSDARAHQVRGRQRAHRPGADDDGGAAGQPARAWRRPCPSATDTTEAPAASMPVSECTRLPTDSARWASSCRVRPTVWLASAAA